MRGRRGRQTEEAEVNMTPMLDIVFILLIFFIVTSTFIRERALDLTPPPPSNENTPTEPQPTILIRVDQDSLVYVNNRITDIGGVRAQIERLRAETPESAVLVQAHPEAKNGLVLQIVDQARSANVEDVGFVLSAI